MKKLMSLLLAGIAVIAMSGCSNGDADIPDSVSLSVLENLEDDDGYLITGVDESVSSATAKTVEPANNFGLLEHILFCSNGSAVLLWEDDSEGTPFTIEDTEGGEGVLINFASAKYEIDTYLDETPGKLENDITYTLESDGNIFDWLVTDIEKVDCSTYYK